MKSARTQSLVAAALVCALACSPTIVRAAFALPSWSDGNAKPSMD